MPPLDDTDTNVDYSNHIPAAVRRSAERAEEIAREIGAAPPLEDPAVDPAAPPAADPVVDPPVVDPPVAEWEQRYRTLQGKYDSEMPQLRAHVASLERVIAHLQAEPAPVVDPSRTTTTTVEIPAAEVEAYGGELISAAQRWARAEVQDDIARLEAQIRGLQGNHQQLETSSVRDRTMQRLDSDPEIGTRWRSLNDNPEFLTWANQVDPFSGQLRLALLRDAYANGDAGRVGEFFKTFIREHTALAPPSPAADPYPASGADRPTLEDLAAPGRATGQPPSSGAPAEKRMWTRNEITAFYREVTAGRYAGREAERIRIERDIHAAIPEGRVRNA